MNFLKNMGIHARILAAAILIITSSTFTLGYFGLDMVKVLVSQRFDRQINYMAEHLAANAELGILIDEGALLNALAKSVLSEKDIIGVEIENKQRTLLAQQTRNTNGTFFTMEKKVYLSHSNTDETDLELIAGSKNRGDIGLVRIRYTREGVKDLTATMAHRFILLSLGLAVASVLIFFLISRSLVLPVVSLAEVARQVSQGNRSLRAPMGTIPETRRLALSFNEMLDSIEKSRQDLLNAQKKLSRQEALAEVGKFSMMIAHEVKNPLAIIKSSLDMLKRDLNIPADNLLLNYTEEEITRLNDLIESFLMFARPTKLKMVKTNLNQVVEQVALGFQMQYSEGIFEIKYTSPDKECISMADNDLLSRALSNVIRNACDASRNQGHIDIDVKISQNLWAVHVRDFGKGIDQKNMKNLFEPFYTTKATGTGLGLAFADQVIKAHGGTITASNHRDGGALFCMEISLDNCNTTTYMAEKSTTIKNKALNDYNQ